MFSSALKSFTSSIGSNYALSPNPTASSGPWKIFDAKKKSTGKAVSVFVFDRKSLDPHSGLGRSGGSSLRKIHDEILERLKKEASSLARLRHPSILELVEPVEETRSGGLMFATEQVTASLASLLEEKDAQERAGGVGGRSSRFVVEDAEGGGLRRRELEIDELEIQKGLLQIGKALEFLHESAGLVHGNLTPEAIFINAKSDWKVSGLGFAGPPDNSNTATSVAPISLSEVLHHDPRLPRSIQLNLDYTSPDFVLDSNVTPSADMFSLGLLIIALYNFPHISPLQTHSSSSTYKKLFGSSSTTPTQSNQFLSSKPLPKDLTSTVLPRLITRRPAQRLTAREFQQSQYFDNILVSSIRFLDSLPAKTPNEKAQFMRGLARVLPQFPKSVLEKKVLPALLEEMKDRDLLSLILQNVFRIVQMLAVGKRAFTEKVLPRLREIFLSPSTSSTSKGAAPERDTGKEAGLMMILENMSTVIDSCSAKDFKDHALPILLLAVESPNHSMVDASFRSLPTVLPALDFSTVKNELFPKVAAVFTKTSSLGIKVRGLEAFNVLCGGSSTVTGNAGDGLDGTMGKDAAPKPTSTGAVLDKYTMQEKMVPLLKAIKTKEPAVMMACLNVLRQVGLIVDCEYVATEVLPILWTMGLGPLLNLQQFQSFMELIKLLSNRVETEQTRKLQELSANSVSDSQSTRTDDFMSFSGTSGSNGAGEPNEGDFERLVLGKQSDTKASPDMGWDTSSGIKSPTGQANATPEAPVFSWSTRGSTPQSPAQRSLSSIGMGTLTPQQGPSSRSITPDLSTFAALSPTASTSSHGFAQPLQPQNQQQQSAFGSTQPSMNWQSMAPAQANPWGAQRTSSSPSLATLNGMSNSMPIQPFGQPSSTLPHSSSAFAIPPPPSATSAFQSQQSTTFNAFALAHPPAGNASLAGSARPGQSGGPANPSAGQKGGLDKYESLL
ncbi:MAG: hypothetical protein M1832_004883 [Thelocarpon impressellum]|nr:MAG: hypothetical protein M1832_004883 [Thelocarpon impressellum]